MLESKDVLHVLELNSELDRQIYISVNHTLALTR